MAQAIKPKIYIDSRGIRYTEAQFDSVGMANMGQPILAGKEIQKAHEIQITFRVFAVDSLALFKEKWIGKPLPPFSLNDVDGTIHSNTSLTGKLLVLDFWSIACTPCLEGMSKLSDLRERFQPKDIVFLAPAPESAHQIQQALGNRTFTFSILPQAQAFFSALGIRGYPHYFIVSKTGIIQAIYAGTLTNVPGYDPIEDDRLEDAIEKALKKQ